MSRNPITFHQAYCSRNYNYVVLTGSPSEQAEVLHRNVELHFPEEAWRIRQAARRAGAPT